MMTSTTFKRQLLFMFGGIFLFLFSCNKPANEKGTDAVSVNNVLQGTWELVSETKIEKEDTTYTPAGKDQRMIKIINQTHFAFLRHDLAHGKDSAAMFVAGGGTYTLKGNHYQEKLDFCNSREWENHTFDFEVHVNDDTLVQQGKEKIESLDIERIIIEKYVRTNQ